MSRTHRRVLVENFADLAQNFQICFSFGVRGSQHLEAIQKPDSHRDNAFVKHAAEYHQGEESEVKFKLEIVGHFSKPAESEVCEGVYVHTDTSDLVMNSKLDHHLPAVSRVTFISSAVEEGRGRGRGGGRSGRGGGTGSRPGARRTGPSP